MPTKIKYLDRKDLRQIREYLDLSQRDLSEISGVTQSTISKFESGVHDVDFDTYFSLLCALEVEAEFKLPDGM